MVPQPTIPDCIEAVAEGHVAYAIVPLENALEGSVPMTIDYLFHESELFINAEISIPIEQHLMVNKKQAAHFDEIESINSHPHALAQCHKYLQIPLPSCPAHPDDIDSSCCKIYFRKSGMKKLRQSETGWRQKNMDYISRKRIFMISILIIRVSSSYHCEKNVWKQKGIQKSCKTTLMVKLPEDDRSGVLHQILSVFAWRKLNLSKIESRPLKTGLGNYFFIIDVLESEDHPMMKGAMEELAALNCSVRSFGSYFTYEQTPSRHTK